jgi:bifunctional non-homologous end joining protein LigD
MSRRAKPLLQDDRLTAKSRPTLIAEIEFRGWTDDGTLRHASYKGLREVQDNAAVYRLD